MTRILKDFMGYEITKETTETGEVFYYADKDGWNFNVYSTLNDLKKGVKDYVNAK